jgi:hypothetical protein
MPRYKTFANESRWLNGLHTSPTEHLLDAPGEVRDTSVFVHHLVLKQSRGLTNKTRSDPVEIGGSLAALG